MNPQVVQESARIWYTHPANRWEAAFPVGNGRLGAMVFGGTREEKIQLNEDSYWTGGPYSQTVKGGKGSLPEIQRLVFAGEYLKAHRLFGRTMMGYPVEQMKYQCLSNLILTFPDSGSVTSTGEQQEERVESVVDDAPLGTHEERATLFLYLAAGTLALTIAGLAKGRAGQLRRAAATVAALALLPAGYLVGHSGGELVYKYGAAQAYVSASTAQGEKGQADQQLSNRSGDDDDR